MNWWYLLFPVTAAALCLFYVLLLRWFLFYPLHPARIAGFVVQGWLFRKRPAVAEEIGLLAQRLVDAEGIAQKLAQPENLAHLLPLAETHIDSFLRVKLVKAMPVVGMFVGDKTIQLLKELFMAELQTLLPDILGQYLSTVAEKTDVKTLVARRIMSVPPDVLTGFIKVQLRKEFRLLSVLSVIAGFLIGIIQLLLLFLAG